MNTIQHSLTIKDILKIISLYFKDPIFLSHHPQCTAFENHTLTIRGIGVCRGCLFMYAGIFLFIPIGIFTEILRLHYIYLSIIMILLNFPTIIFSILSMERLYKDISRILLGINIGLSIIIMLTTYQHWFVRLIVFLVFAGTYIPLSNIRKQRNIAHCLTCNENEKRINMSCYGLEKSRYIRMQIIKHLSEKSKLNDY